MDYLALCNRVLHSLNEVELTAANFSSSKGIQTAVKEFVNRSINDIYSDELEWPFLHSDTTQVTTAGTAEYSLPADYRNIDYDSFVLRPTQLLSTNEFSSDASWSHTGGSISGGLLVLTAGTSSEQTVTSFVKNRTYRVTLRMTGTGTLTLKVGTSSGGTQITSTDFTVSNLGEGKLHSMTFTATASTLYVTLAGSTATVNVDFITINEDTQPKALTYLTYNGYIKNHKENDIANNPSSYNTPQYVYPTQDGKFGLTPIPDRGNYTIVYEYWTTHSDLSASDSEPAIYARYQDAIIAKAEYYVHQLRSNLDAAVIKDKEYQSRLLRMRIDLINKPEYMRTL